MPEYVFRTPDNNYGLFPYPDKAYTLKYDAFVKPTALSAATDAPTIPEQFRQVIVDGATTYGYQYRGEAQQYGINFSRFEAGIKHMQSLFLNRNFNYIRSTFIPRSQRYGTVAVTKGFNKWLTRRNLAHLFLRVRRTCSTSLRSRYTGMALELQNFEPDISGGYRRISGYAKWNSNIVPQTAASTEPVLMVALFNSKVIATRGTKIFEAGTTGSWSEIDTGRTSAGRYTFFRYNLAGTDFIIWADGANNATKYDGTTVTDINASGAPANPKFVTGFKDHIFLLACPARRNKLHLLHRSQITILLLAMVQGQSKK